MRPEFKNLLDGYADPMTLAYGASDVISDSINRHVARCSHAWCVGERQP